MLPLPKQDLPVHLRANPFFVFSFEFPFILSPSFISSVTCLPALLTTSYQTVPWWEASEDEEEGRKKGERKSEGEWGLRKGNECGWSPGAVSCCPSLWEVSIYPVLSFCLWILRVDLLLPVRQPCHPRSVSTCLKYILPTLIPHSFYTLSLSCIFTSFIWGCKICKQIRRTVFCLRKSGANCRYICLLLKRRL